MDLVEGRDLVPVRGGDEHHRAAEHARRPAVLRIPLLGEHDVLDGDETAAAVARRCVDEGLGAGRVEDGVGHEIAVDVVQLHRPRCADGGDALVQRTLWRESVASSFGHVGIVEPRRGDRRNSEFVASMATVPAAVPFVGAVPVGVRRRRRRNDGDRRQDGDRDCAYVPRFHRPLPL